MTDNNNHWEVTTEDTTIKAGEVFFNPYFNVLAPTQGIDTKSFHNLSLIQQAPELFRLLNFVVEVIESEYPECQWEDYKVLEMRDVLKKARGK